jgi:hypothetical protein
MAPGRKKAEITGGNPFAKKGMNLLGGLDFACGSTERVYFHFFSFAQGLGGRNMPSVCYPSVF